MTKDQRHSKRPVNKEIGQTKVCPTEPENVPPEHVWRGRRSLVQANRMPKGTTCYLEMERARPHPREVAEVGAVGTYEGGRSVDYRGRVSEGRDWAWPGFHEHSNNYFGKEFGKLKSPFIMASELESSISSFKIHDVPQYIEATAKLINEEWPRGLAGRYALRTMNTDITPY